MTRYYITNGNCGAEAAYKMIASRWKPWIIHFCCAQNGCTFSALQTRLTEISDSMLSGQLRALVNDGLLYRNDSGVYQATEKLQSLLPIMAEMQDFSVHVGYDAADFSSSVEFSKTLIGNKWRSRVIWVLHHNGSTRFNELQHSIEGLSHKILSEILKSLDEYRLINVKDYHEKKPHVEYSLTPLGEEAFDVIKNLANFSLRYGLIQPRITIDY